MPGCPGGTLSTIRSPQAARSYDHHQDEYLSAVHSHVPDRRDHRTPTACCGPTWSTTDTPASRGWAPFLWRWSASGAGCRGRHLGAGGGGRERSVWTWPSCNVVKQSVERDDSRAPSRGRVQLSGGAELSERGLGQSIVDLGPRELQKNFRMHNASQWDATVVVTRLSFALTVRPFADIPCQGNPDSFGECAPVASSRCSCCCSIAAA